MRESFIDQRCPSAAKRHSRQPGERSVLLRSLLKTLSCLNHGRRLPRPISTPCGPTTRRTGTGWSGDSTGLPTKIISKSAWRYARHGICPVRTPSGLNPTGSPLNPGLPSDAVDEPLFRQRKQGQQGNDDDCAGCHYQAPICTIGAPLDKEGPQPLRDEIA